MGEVLALALGIAASPFGGIGVVVGVFVGLASVLDPCGGSPTWLSWVRIAAGLALVGYGVRQWITRHASTELPGWLQSPLVSRSVTLT